jgi:Kef-type K+ transport system membrane component KefB
MELSRNRAKKWETAGLLALATAACAGCCAPLLGALLAASGIGGLAVAEQFALAAALFAASAVALLLVLHRRRRKKCGCVSTR